MDGSRYTRWTRMEERIILNGHYNPQSIHQGCSISGSPFLTAFVTTRSCSFECSKENMEPRLHGGIPACTFKRQQLATLSVKSQQTTSTDHPCRSLRCPRFLHVFLASTSTTAITWPWCPIEFATSAHSCHLSKFHFYLDTMHVMRNQPRTPPFSWA